MKKYIIILVGLILISCNQEVQKSKDKTEVTNLDEADNSELEDMDGYPPKLDSIVEPITSQDDSIMKKYIRIAQRITEFPGDNNPYISDVQNIPNIDRPLRSFVKDSKYPLENLIGYWGGFGNEPVNDFAISATKFDVADYEGDGTMPYILYNDSLIVFYNDFVRIGRITASK